MESLMSNIWLVFYITAWTVTIIIYQKKKKHFDAGSVILYSYLLYSIVSLFLYNSSFYSYNYIIIFPFIYLYLMIMLTALPVLKYNSAKINLIQQPSNVLLNTVSIIIIVAAFGQLLSIIADLSSNMVNLVINSSGGQELYDDAMANSYSYGSGNIKNLAAIISNAFKNFGILTFFYYLTLDKRNKFILLGLFFSIIVNILTNLSLAQRGPIIEILLLLIITFFALKKFIQPRINKIIKITGISLIVATSIPLVVLTNSRFEDWKGGSLESTFYYVGQENLNFNNYGLDNGGIRYGDRTFPLFKRMLGFDNVPNNFWERRQKYPDLKINDEVFIGFIGDFTLDFGPFIPPLIFIGFTLFVLKKTKIRNRRILFHQLILIHFVIYSWRLRI